MSLFSIEDIKPTKAGASALLQSATAAGNVAGKSAVATKSRYLIKKIEALLVAGAEHIDFVSAGELNLHTLIEHLMFRHPDNACDLYLSTWAIKDAAARSIIKMLDSGQVNAMYGVFDYRIQSVDGPNFKPIRHLFKNYTLTKNHAKVVVIDFFDFHYTILTSANMSANPRIEAGYISRSADTAGFHKGWMHEVLSGKKIH